MGGIQIKNNLNLFAREPISPKGERAKEIENNVTRAFLITLINDKKMAKKLVKKLTGAKLSNKFEVDFQLSESRKSETLEKKKKIILFINSEDNTSEISNEKEEKQRNTPDGLISDKNIAILVEAKVGASKSPDQIARYNKIFFHGAGKLPKKPVTWQGAYSNITKIKSQKYITNEFLKYLEVIGLSGFSGISFFDRETGDEWNSEDAKRITKELCKELEKFLGQKDLVLGKRPKTEAWDYFYLKKFGKTKKPAPQTIPHMSFGLGDSKAFDVMVTFNKKNTLKKILGSESIWKKFFEKIAKFSEDPNTYLIASHYKMLAHKEKYKGHRQGPKYSDFKIEFQLSRLNKDSEEYFKNLLNLVAKEYMKEIAIVKKFYYKDSKLDNEIAKFADGKRALEKIKQTINELKPYYDFIVKIDSEKSGKKAKR